MKLASTHEFQAIRKGDIQSFEKVFKRSYAPLCELAWQILGDEGLAEEAVQEMFYRLWLNHAKMNPVLSPASYLKKAVRNNALMIIRRQNREEGLDGLLKDAESTTAADPDSLLQEKELKEKLDRVLNNLPERTRQIYQMSRINGMSYQEIARELSLSVKTVEAHISRSLKLLREAVDTENN